MNSLASGSASLINTGSSSVLHSAAGSCGWGRHLAALCAGRNLQQKSLPSKAQETPRQKANTSAGMLVLVCPPPFPCLCTGRDNGPPPSPLCAGSRDNVGLEIELTQSSKPCLFENESLLLVSNKQMFRSRTTLQELLLINTLPETTEATGFEG